jgi:gluconolactonase
VLLDRDPKLGIVGFNDLTTDAMGRIYVGSLCLDPFKPDQRTPRPGWLHVIDTDGSSRRLADNVLLTNGLGSGAPSSSSSRRAARASVSPVRCRW